MSCCASSGGGAAAARKTCHPPGVHSTYFELYRMRTDRHWLHQKLVAFARANGLKAAAREFGCSRNTVRKWLRRHVPGKPSALAELSRRPKHCPHQTSSALEGVIVRLRKQTAFGAERLQHEFQLPVSHNAIARILRAHHLTRPRKKKPATKKQLRHVKRLWPLFGQLSTDTKYFQDIPHYWPQMTHLKLPRFQYTAREPVSGACFTGYADELSKSYATFHTATPKPSPTGSTSTSTSTASAPRSASRARPSRPGWSPSSATARPGRTRLEKLDEDVVYDAASSTVTSSPSTRSAPSSAPSATTVQAARRGIFPGRSEVPKTLIFAKDDCHADDIVRICREEFGRGNDFAVKITYRTTGVKPEDLLNQFRNSFNPRIAVTVDMIATGTDVRRWSA